MKAETKLEVVSTKRELQSVGEYKAHLLDQDVEEFEGWGGNLKKFLAEAAELGLAEEKLFSIESELNQPENKELKKRWQKALRTSAKIRMDLLRCKAFDILERYENKSSSSSATDIAFAKSMLIGILVEDSEMVKSRYRPAASPLGPGVISLTHDAQDDAVSDLEKEFDEAGEV